MRWQHNLPICFYPSVALLISSRAQTHPEDDQLLRNKIRLVQTASPVSALKYLQRCDKPSGYYHEISSREIQSVWPLQARIHNIELSYLLLELYNPQRFEEISVIAIEQALYEKFTPHFIDFINQHSAKLIILTPECQAQTSIIEAQQHYFNEVSSKTLRLLDIPTPMIFTDKQFIHYFNHFCQEKNIIEFYLIEDSGSLLCISQSNVIYTLIIKTQAQVEQIKNLAANRHYNIEPNATDVIPYFWQDNQTQLDFRPAQKHAFENEYLIGLFDSDDSLPLELEKISFFTHNVNQV